MFKLHIDTQNEAFEGNLHCETIRCLKEVIKKLEQNNDDGSIVDINGNLVGSFKMYR